MELPLLLGDLESICQQEVKTSTSQLSLQCTLLFTWELFGKKVYAELYFTVQNPKI